MKQVFSISVIIITLIFVFYFLHIIDDEIIKPNQPSIYFIEDITNIKITNNIKLYKYRIKSINIENCGSHTFYAIDTIVYNIGDTLRLIGF